MSAQFAGILQIAIPVQDVPRATAFYRDALELNLIMASANMAFFDCGGVRLYLSRSDHTDRAEASSYIYFRTEDIRRCVLVLREKQVSIHQEPGIIAKMPDHDLWLMWIRDSEGNLLDIMEERKTRDR